MLNSVNLMGRLTADPELKQTVNGISVISFTIAVDRAYTPKGQDKQTDFINIAAWRQTAEFISKYFAKGQMIALEGSIQTRSYEDKQGNKRTAFEVVAGQVHFCGGKNEKSDSRQSNAQQSTATNTPADVPTDFDGFEEIGTDDSDLPF